MPFEVKKAYKKPVAFVKSLKPPKGFCPNFIRDPINSSIVPTSTKRRMMKHSHNSSFASLSREALEQATGFEESIDSMAKRWLEWDRDPVTSLQIMHLRAKKDKETLETLLRNRIEFGTAGLRGCMAAGFANMNSLVVIQTSQGLAQYILDRQPDANTKGVVIGHDTRDNSEVFAKLAASAFLAKGIKVLWFKDYVPTPFVSFAVRHLNAAAGVMITASHNPARDNGYKVYWSNGAQINSPHDVGISACIHANLKPWTTAWDTSAMAASQDITATIKTDYMKAVSEFALGTAGVKDSNDLLTRTDRFVYTPFQGVGYKFFQELAVLIGVHKRMSVVEQQREPDPKFSTLPYPNPEERSTFEMAFAEANSNGIDLIIVNDPDADRFAVAERVNKSWHKFTGDQIGILLADYMKPKPESKHIVKPQSKDTEEPGSKSTEKPGSQDTENLEAKDNKTYMLNTAVSSQFLADMDGFTTEETLTGFKWLGNRACQLEEAGETVPFAYEEALGYMFPRISYDKDGLAAAAVFLVALTEWKKEGHTPWTKLQTLYMNYGLSETANISFPSFPKVTLQMFQKIRRQFNPLCFPAGKSVHLGQYHVHQIRDLTTGTEWNLDLPTENQIRAPDLPVTKTVQMITFWLHQEKNNEDTLRFTLRGSGTEPKVKLYLEVRAKSQERAHFLIQDAFEVIANEIIRKNSSQAENYFASVRPTITSSSGLTFRFPPKRVGVMEESETPRSVT